MEQRSHLILIVEDDPDSRAMLEMLLRMNGFRTLTAANGAEALTVARAHRPTLILLDLMMPVMDGREFRLAQLQDASVRAIPVMLVTASHNGPLEATRLRAVCCVTKPIDVPQLMAQVQSYCEGRPTP